MIQNLDKKLASQDNISIPNYSSFRICPSCADIVDHSHNDKNISDTSHSTASFQSLEESNLLTPQHPVGPSSPDLNQNLPRDVFEPKSAHLAIISEANSVQPLAPFQNALDLKAVQLSEQSHIRQVQRKLELEVHQLLQPRSGIDNPYLVVSPQIQQSDIFSDSMNNPSKRQMEIPEIEETRNLLPPLPTEFSSQSTSLKPAFKFNYNSQSGLSNFHESPNLSTDFEFFSFHQSQTKSSSTALNSRPSKNSISSTNYAVSINSARSIRSITSANSDLSDTSATETSNSEAPPSISNIQLAYDLQHDSFHYDYTEQNVYGSLNGSNGAHLQSFSPSSFASPPVSPRVASNSFRKRSDSGIGSFGSHTSLASEGNYNGYSESISPAIGPSMPSSRFFQKLRSNIKRRVSLSAISSKSNLVSASSNSTPSFQHPQRSADSSFGALDDEESELSESFDTAMKLIEQVQGIQI